MESKGQEEQLKAEVEKAKAQMAKPGKAPDMSADRAFKGPKDAPLTIVGYSDFQCPYCSRGFQTIEKVLAAYPGKIRYIHKHLPLPMHPMAMPAAKRYEAIALQSLDLAAKYHDEVFQNQNQLGSDGEKYLDDAAKKVGADVAKMKKEMNSDKVKKRIAADSEEAKSYGFEGTPGYYVAGATIGGAYPFEFFQKLIDFKLSSK